MEYRRFIGGHWLGGSALLCLALGACNKAPQGAEQPVQQPATGAPIAALQLATAPPPPPTYAPPASKLPPPPRRVAYRPRREHWRYLTDAYDMSDAFGDTPPDYTIPYDGEDPYVWRADDGAYRVVEWLPEGARYYYYEPGADEPFLIEDPDYSYAYDDGALVRVYTRRGAPVPDRIAAEREAYAARYYARAHDLYRAAVSERRRAAYAAHWQQRAPIIREQRTLWQRGREEEPGWRDWYQAHQPQQEARWAPERQHREAYAAALGAAGAAGAAYALHRRDQPPAQQIAGMRPVPRPQAGMDDRLRPFPSVQDQRAEQAQRQAAQQAAQAQQRQLQQAQQTQRLEAQRQAQAQRAQAQAREQQARQTQQRQLQQAQQTQRLEAQRQEQARQAQQHQLQQTQQAQRRELQQAQQAQRAEAQRHAQTRRAETQARMQQAQQEQRAAAQREAQAQRRELQQAQQAQHAEAQRQAQAQRAQAHAEAHIASPPVQTAHLQPPHAEAPRPNPAQHAQATPPPAPQPASHPHGGDQKEDRHHH